MIENNKKYLVEARITFTDCLMYEWVYGECEIFNADKEVGFTLRRSENWFIKVKGDKGEIIIPGCRIGLLIRTDNTPNPAIVSKEDLDKGWRYEPQRVLIL